MTDPALYDRIGKGYPTLRRPDPRIAAQIHASLGNAQTVVNVGAGTGSYEPNDRKVTAIEPSAAMIAQRPSGAAPVVQASAEALPFPDKSFDAAMAVLTVHHWPDQVQGLHEMRRVARGPVVLVTFDPAHPGTWLGDYLPELRRLDEEQMPAMDFYAGELGPVDISPILIPHDCVDGFLYAYWRRPEAYLDPALRQGSSSFHKLEGLEEGFMRLQRNLESGEWARQYGHLCDLEEFDAGYRLVVA